MRCEGRRVCCRAHGGLRRGVRLRARSALFAQRYPLRRYRSSGLPSRRRLCVSRTLRLRRTVSRQRRRHLRPVRERARMQGQWRVHLRQGGAGVRPGVQRGLRAHGVVRRGRTLHPTRWKVRHRQRGRLQPPFRVQGRSGLPVPRRRVPSPRQSERLCARPRLQAVRLVFLRRGLLCGAVR